MSVGRVFSTILSRRRNPDTMMDYRIEVIK